MKTLVWFLMLTLGALGTSTAQTQPAQARLLYDSRIQTPEPRLTESERGEIKFWADRAAEARAWSRLEYAEINYSKQCTGSDFRINGVALGSFTRAKAAQRAYLYNYCWYNHADVLQGLVIMEGKKVVSHYVFHDHYQQLQAIKDSNTNGQDELLFVGFFTGQGTTEGWLNLAELQQGVRFLGQLDYQHLPAPYSDNCGAADPAGTWESVVLRVLPGSTPRYFQQAIKGRCTNMNKATTSGAVQPLSLQTILVDWQSGPVK